MTISPKKDSDIFKPAIRVTQPLGTFYAFSVGADVLSRITYSQPAEVISRMDNELDDNKGGYSIFGTQRNENKKRLEEIASFIRTTEATFPNSIILAANYDQDGRYIDEEVRQWTVDHTGDDTFRLRIPMGDRSASIIDGQHRLHAFDKLPKDAPERNMELLCVVFLELPVPYHAYVFATINFNQKKVDRSLAYDLFGFDVDERPSQFWSPETLAVYLARLLNTEPQSPLFRSIFPAADSEKIFANNNRQPNGDIRVSMATIVDGILRLISRNPKEDRNRVRRPENRNTGRSSLTPINGLPMRDHYIAANDKALYELLCNYFGAVKSSLWDNVGVGSYLRKTVGLQALFDVLRVILATTPVTAERLSEKSFRVMFDRCAKLDPDGNKYQASGIGRSDIRRDLLDAIGIQA